MCMRETKAKQAYIWAWHTHTEKREHLVRIPVYDWLLLEFQLTWILTISLYTHCTIVITIQLSQYKIVYWCRYLREESPILNWDLTENKHFPIICSHTLLHWSVSPSSNSKVKIPVGSSWIERPQNLLFKLLSAQNFHPVPSQWHATIIGWWLTWHNNNKLTTLIIYLNITTRKINLDWKNLTI